MKNMLILIILVIVVAPTLYGQFESFTAVSASQPFLPLRNLGNKQFQNDLQRAINANHKWKSLVNQKRMAIGLVDMRKPDNIKFAQINGNTMMYAASLPKIAVLLAAADALDKGELFETEEVLQDLRLMIAKSDNQASTRMIDRLGYKKIESVLTDPKYRLYDKRYGGGLWVGKRYASQGARYPDPILGLSHAATATQVSRFYYLLAMGKLVSPERSAQMMDILEDPALHHKFVHTLGKLAPKASLFRKSGSWKTYHSDSVMVLGNDRRYILVALINDQEGEMICRELVVAVENILKSTSPILPTAR